MRKILFTILLSAFCLLLSSCGNIAESTEEYTTASPETEADTKPTVTDTATTSAPPPEQTAATNTKYSSITQIPQIYRIDKNGANATYAARMLTEMMLESLQEIDESRSFTLSYHKLTALNVEQSSEIAKDENKYENLNESLFAKNIFIVRVNFYFSYLGEYEGTVYEDGDQTYLFRTVDEDLPLLMMETEDEYLMWWASAYPEENCPSELKSFIGIATEPPAETEATKLQYLTIANIPGVHVMEKSGHSPEEAAQILMEEMLASMATPSDDRAFCILEYRNLEIKVIPSAEIPEYGNSIILPNNAYLVRMQAEYRYSGVYNPIGPNSDKSKWWSPIRHGGEVGNPLILLETEDEYMMWWQEAYRSGRQVTFPPETEGLLIW